MKSNKWIILIGLSVIALISIPLFFLPVTPFLIIATIFAAIGVIGIVLTSLVLSEKAQKFFEFTPFTRPYLFTALFYLLINVLFSALGLLLSQLISWQLFLAGHIIILVIFIIRMFLITSGKEYIQAKDLDVQSKVNAKRIMQADLDQIIQKAKSLPSEERAKALREMQSVAEGLRYSDPMVDSSLQEFEITIQEDIMLLGKAVEESDYGSISKICQDLQQTITNRNLRVKSLK